jgi:hypothetical protein
MVSVAVLTISRVTYTLDFKPTELGNKLVRERETETVRQREREERERERDEFQILARKPWERVLLYLIDD